MEFTVNFQLRILILFYRDKEFLINCRDLVKGEFFRSLFLQWLFKLVNSHVDTYKVLPTSVVVEQELKNDKTFIRIPEEEGLITEFFQLIDKPDISDLQYVKDGFIKFAKQQTIRKALSDRDEAISQGDFDGIFTGLKLASKKFDFLQAEESPYLFSLKNLKEIYEATQGIATGIKLIDTTVGGLLPKEVSCVFADTNVGKSLYLVHLGGKAVRQFRKTIHVTLEMSKARTLARYLANFGEPEGIAYSNIINFDPEEKVFNYVHGYLRERYEDYLKIIEFPTGKCGIHNLYNLLEKYPGTELLIVDYLQLLKAPKRRDQLRFELSDIAIALRGVASESGLHVATAQQASKLAANRRLVGKELTAEDYGIPRVIDLGMGMGQNQQDALNQQVVFWLTKSRNSAKNLAERYQIDFRHMTFRYMADEQLNGGNNHHDQD